MPLNKSGSKKAVGENIATEEAAGKPRKQAIAIALSEQRRSKKMASKKYGDMHMGGEHNDVVDEMGKHVEAGKDGSHQDHKKQGGHRGAIHVGSPTELERHHEKDE